MELWILILTGALVVEGMLQLLLSIKKVIHPDSLGGTGGLLLKSISFRQSLTLRKAFVQKP